MCVESCKIRLALVVQPNWRLFCVAGHSPGFSCTGRQKLWSFIKTERDWGSEELTGHTRTKIVIVKPRRWQVALNLRCKKTSGFLHRSSWVFYLMYLSIVFEGLDMALSIILLITDWLHHCLLSTNKLVCGGCSGAIWLPSHHPGWCCTLVVVWGDTPSQCKALWVSRKALYKFN